ncbi:MAG: PLP-dependent cysteine synthase family protein [Deltaproteobacteria bacterium]|nr:PLP-dependent cysteine synthase family protein [Deltaproteobacteria bacterium]
MNSSWAKEAIKKIHADQNRSADTHLLKLPLAAFPNIDLYLKDESTHITGSLKHRLARSLFLHALVNGWIQKNTPVIEASSGSTAVSEAYFARLIGVRFIAVMAKGTSPAKIKRIEHYGGECVLVDTPSKDCEHAKKLAKKLNGHFMNQFLYAEQATDWRGNNNIAESIFDQLKGEQYVIPSWIVCGAGTGGTSATLGRYIRYAGHNTKLCVVDPENSVFYDYYKTKNCSLKTKGGSGVEGIGRPQVEPSFLPNVIDHMIRVPNKATYACMHVLEELIGKKCGGSTGTIFYGSLKLMQEMKTKKQKGSVVMMICDAGDLYLDTYYNNEWLKKNGIKIDPEIKKIQNLIA